MPVYTDTTEQLYALVPAHHRRADAEQEGELDQPLKRCFSAIGDRFHELVLLMNRLAYFGADGLPASDLADPALADAAWLPWLAQWVGVDLSTLPAVSEHRTAITSARFDDGSTGSFRRMIEMWIGDAAPYNIIRRSGGNRWAVKVQLYAGTLPGSTYDQLADEYPSYADMTGSGLTYEQLGAVLLAIQRSLAALKPAWVLLTVEIIAGATYGDLSDEFATYADLAATGLSYGDLSSYTPTP
jgi:hypothetical protein